MAAGLQFSDFSYRRLYEGLATDVFIVLGIFLVEGIPSSIFRKTFCIALKVL